MIGILFAFQIGNNKIKSDKAKPRVIVGRKATGPDLRDSRVAEAELKKPDYRGFIKR